MTNVTQLNAGDEGGADRRRIHLREISGDSDAPLETVGQDLRAARLRRGDDLATVSRALKIRKDHLSAVEEDNFAELPGKTYAIGFVRSYSGYLGLDVNETVERYKQEIAGRHEEHLPAATNMHEDDSRRLPYGWRIVAGIVVLAVAGGVWHLLSAGGEPQPVPPPPALNPPHPQVAAVRPAPPPLPDTATGQTGQSATPPPAASQSSAPPSPPATSSQTASAVAAAPTQGSATPAAAVPAVPAAPQTGHVYGGLNSNARVILRARGDTHILVRGEDGMVYINRSLKAGDSYQLPNIVGLSLAASNAGAVEVDLDGLAMGRAGGASQAADGIALDPQEIVDRFNNRPG